METQKLQCVKKQDGTLVSWCPVPVLEELYKKKKEKKFLCDRNLSPTDKLIRDMRESDAKNYPVLLKYKFSSEDRRLRENPECLSSCWILGTLFFSKKRNLYLANISLVVLSGAYHFKKNILPKTGSWSFSFPLICWNTNIEQYCCLIFSLAPWITN